MAGEFELIRRYFEAATHHRADVLLGIGDDCALLQPPPSKALAVSSDTLVSGRHFEPEIDPESLGHKALAVNLSDLAAMGAEPAWASLCLTLPQGDEAWLERFMRGFSGLADASGVQLIGGDTTRGPLSISVTVHGLVDPERALRRDRAREGDLLYVSGTLGDAGLALWHRLGRIPAGEGIAIADQRLDRPQPRIGLGLALLGYSRCAIDISDGLGADLGHLCERSGLGAELDLERLPLSPAVRAQVAKRDDWTLPLSAGDDYELLFTLPVERRTAFEQEAATWDVPVTRIGRMLRGEGVRIRTGDGSILQGVERGYDHFAD